MNFIGGRLPTNGYAIKQNFSSYLNELGLNRQRVKLKRYDVANPQKIYIISIYKSNYDIA